MDNTHSHSSFRPWSSTLPKPRPLLGSLVASSCGMPLSETASQLHRPLTFSLSSTFQNRPSNNSFSPSVVPESVFGWPAVFSAVQVRFYSHLPTSLCVILTFLRRLSRSCSGVFPVHAMNSDFFCLLFSLFWHQCRFSADFVILDDPANLNLEGQFLSLPECP